jgi:small subunit ribosomal protein S20
MPQHKSAEKRVRTSIRKRDRNRAYKSRMRTMIKKLRNTTDKAVAAELYKDVSSMLDRVSTKGIVHKNFAANKKAKLAKIVQSLG